MLSPVVRGRREEESPSTRGPAVSSDFSQNLLKITSKQEIIYAPPRQESSLSPSKTQFEENFMKQLRAEVSDESSLGLKKRSSDLGDMNEVVQNLDRKKLEMLRSFIASPFDTIGSAPCQVLLFDSFEYLYWLILCPGPLSSGLSPPLCCRAL